VYRKWVYVNGGLTAGRSFSDAFFELLDFGESQFEAQPTISGSFRRKTPQTKPKSNIAQHKTSNNSKILPASEGDIGKIANGQT